MNVHFINLLTSLNKFLYLPTALKEEKYCQQIPNTSLFGVIFRRGRLNSDECKTQSYFNTTLYKFSSQIPPSQVTSPYSTDKKR